MKKALLTAYTVGLFALPAVVSAQDGDLGGTQSIAGGLGDLVQTLVPIAFLLIIIAFFWGLATYVMNANNEEGKDRGKRIMIGGIIALFIASSIWGIVAFLQGELGVSGDIDDQEVPSVNTSEI